MDWSRFALQVVLNFFSFAAMYVKHDMYNGYKVPLRTKGDARLKILHFARPCVVGSCNFDENH